LELQHEKKIQERAIEDFWVVGGNEDICCEEPRNIRKIAQDVLIQDYQRYVIEVRMLVGNTLCVDDAGNKRDEEIDVRISQ
jgi:hypothetical protein